MSRFYGFPCFNLSRVERFALQSAMPMLKAEEEIERGDVPDNRIYDVVLRATGSESEASASLSARVAARLRQGETPDLY